MTTIVGREQWLARLRADVHRTVTSHGGLVLIAGEAGIGKTTLVGNVVRQAREAGAAVAAATCPSSAAAPELWPWSQLVRGLRRAVGAPRFAELADQVGLEVADALRLAAPLAGPDHHFALFGATAELVATIAQERPLVLVIEDLHWADRTSLELLDFVNRQSWFERLLLVGTYRDTEVDQPDHPLHDAMHGLSPQGGTINLTGLDAADVSALVAQVAGRTPDGFLAAELHRRTGGNPFFAEQVARLWANGQGEDALAPGVTETVRRRLRPLPADTNALLAAAAVIGSPFSLRLASEVAGLSASSGSAAVAAALAARLLRVVGDGTFEFVHDLVLETVRADLDEAETRRLHAAVVDALPDHPDDVLPGAAAEYAVRAGDLVPAERRVDLLVAAGRDAVARVAPEEAWRCYRRAVEVCEEPDRRLLIKLDLVGEMYFAAALNRGSTAEAASMLTEVIAEAETHDAITAARVGVAARSYGDIDIARADALVRSATERLVTGPLPDDPDKLADVTTQTLADLARERADAAALIDILSTRHHALWRPGTAAERKELVTEMQTVARRSGDRDTEQFATSMLWVTLLEQGDPGYLEHYRTFVALTERYATPRFLSGADVDGAVIAGFEGRFDDALDLLARVDGAHPTEELYRWITRFVTWSVHLRRGEIERARALLETLFGTELDHAVLAAAQACEEGDPRGAIRLLAEGDAARRGQPTSGLQMRLPALRDRVAAIAAAATRDPRAIRRARERLQPVSGTWSVDLFGTDVGGPIDLYLGRLEAAAGDSAAATRLLERAVTSADRLATPYWGAVGRIALLDVLGTGDRRTGRVRDDLATLLDGLDVPWLHERAVPLLTAGATVPSPAIDEVAGEFRSDGPVWQVGLGQHVVAVPDAKGLRDLHLLLSSPGVEVASVRLLNPDADPAADTALRQAGDAVLDDTARQQYRARLTILDDELDVAGLYDDTERRDELLAEREALIAELRAATGLGGRPRRLGDQAERARKTVGARIRDTLRKLDEVHPTLARHLRESVSTGSSCRYSPSEPAIRWRLR